MALNKFEEYKNKTTSNKLFNKLFEARDFAHFAHLEAAKKYADLVKQQKDEARRKEEEAHRKHLEQLAEDQRIADDKEKRDLQYQLDQMDKIRKKFAGKLEPIGTDGLTKTEREKALKDEEERKELARQREELERQRNIARDKWIKQIEIDVDNNNIPLDSFWRSQLKQNQISKFINKIEDQSLINDTNNKNSKNK